MELASLQDIYRCPECDALSAHGNQHCRGCGIKFTLNHIRVMEANIKIPLAASPINMRDRYRCIHCLEFISIQDQYCRQCGDFIDSNEKNIMKANLRELAQQNTPALLGLMGFVILVILFSIALVK